MKTHIQMRIFVLINAAKNFTLKKDFAARVLKHLKLKLQRNFAVVLTLKFD